MEPRAATPMRRLEAFRRLAQAGVPTTVMVAPVIPGAQRQRDRAHPRGRAAAGVKEAGYVLLRLPLEVRDLFKEWLKANYPDREATCSSSSATCAAARTTTPNGSAGMTGTGPIAWMIGRRFELACEKLGFNASKFQLTTEHFRKPRPGSAQLSLF